MYIAHLCMMETKGPKIFASNILFVGFPYDISPLFLSFSLKVDLAFQPQLQTVTLF